MPRAYQSEIHHLLEEKKKSALRLDPKHDCLFCTHHAADIEANIAHMSSAHSFFLPDIEYMVDLHGMLTYLADKVSVMNLCLYCDGVGRGFHSLEAARRHMLDKGHTKVRYEEEEDREELAEYYDFSATWEGVEDEAVTDEEWEDADSGSSSDDDDMEVVDEAETRTIRTKARGGIAYA